MEKEIVRPSLGRRAIVGDLYDIRTDTFCEGSLFDFPLPETALQVNDKTAENTEILLTGKMKLEDKFKKFHVKPEMMVNVLGDLCIPEGASEFLSTELNGQNAVSAALLHTVKISELKEDIAKNSQKVGCATHVVIGVTWGLQLVINLQDKKKDNLPDFAIERKLRSALQKFEKVLVGRNDVRFYSNEKASLKFFSDLMQVGKDSLPDTYESLVTFLENLPDILKNCNDGKGMQISYFLIPLSALKEQIDAKVIVLPWTTAESGKFVQVYENFLQIKQRILDTEDEWSKHWDCISEEAQQAFRYIKFKLENVDESLKETFRRKPNNSQDILSEYKDMFKSITEALSNLSSTNEKVRIVADLEKKNVQYIQKSQDIGTMFSDFPAKNLYVLNYHSEAKLRDKDRWESNKDSFLELVNHSKRDGTNKFFIADYDFGASDCISEITILHYQNGNCISTDLVALQAKLANICFAKSSSAKSFRSVLPKKRAFMEIMCPGALKNVSPCESSAHKWQCFKCKSFLEYGFDERVYCSCGCARVDSFEFRCNHKNHGDRFRAFERSCDMKKMLNELKPNKQLNILILGETGVGKSTWINGFANYLTFESLENAAKSDPRYLISSSFTMTDDTFQEKTITMGSDENENLAVGQSPTQMPRSYVLHSGETSIRLIDTPGIGDTRGAEQDKENFQNILAHLTYIDEIHGICILLKPNNSRLTIVFQFCVKELLTHLHRDASKNIVFIFTNVRSTFYRPGDTLPPLRSLLEQHDDIMIPLNKDTIYCMDNESIHFLPK